MAKSMQSTGMMPKCSLPKSKGCGHSTTKSMPKQVDPATHHGDREGKSDSKGRADEKE